MTPHQAYRRSAQSSWSRIEMLLAIYDATIDVLDAGIDAFRREMPTALPTLQLRGSQLLVLLISGIDAESSEVAARNRDLCVFCVEQLRSRQVADWVAARNILATVREGFQAIREQGIQLEADGVIGKLTASASHTLLHV